MILFFSYFWVATQFNEIQIADDLKKNGGYIPGVRPGHGHQRLSAPRHEPHHAGGRDFPDGHCVIPIILSRQMNIDQNVAPAFLAARAF